MGKNLLILISVILSVGGFTEGAVLMIDSPFQILIALLSLILVNMLFMLMRSAKPSMRVIHGSLIERVVSSRRLSTVSVIILWILALGNFVFAFNHPRSGLFVLPIILALIAYIIFTGQAME
jgi:hypothetical protein